MQQLHLCLVALLSAIVVLIVWYIHFQPNDLGLQSKVDDTLKAKVDDLAAKLNRQTAALAVAQDALQAATARELQLLKAAAAREAHLIAHIPKGCQSMVASYDETGEVLLGKIDGESGGAWSPARHLCQYGFNFPDALARLLTFQLRPRSVLEFGCGLGLTADYIARYGQAKVLCIEPNQMLPEIFATGGDQSKSLHQLLVDVTNVSSAADSACREALKGAKFDLVMTLEVLEHIDITKHPLVLDLLSNCSGKYLVFSAAREGQGGNGHISLRNEDHYISEFSSRGLKLLPKLTQLARNAAYMIRSYDLHGNLLVFGASAQVNDTDSIYEVDPLVYGQFGRNGEYDVWIEYQKTSNPNPNFFEHFHKNNAQETDAIHNARELAQHVFQWFITSTLWPKTHLMLRNRTEMCQELGSEGKY